MNFQLTATSSRGNSDVIDATGVTLTTLHYEDWFSSTASATVAGRPVQIKTRNIWQSNFDILIGGIDRGDLMSNWKGHIIIKFVAENGVPCSFLLKAKGFWQQHFVLENEQGASVLEMHPSFKWQNMHYNYAVQFPENEFSPFDRQLLLVTCGAQSVHDDDGRGCGLIKFMTVPTLSSGSSIYLQNRIYS